MTWGGGPVGQPPFPNLDSPQPSPINEFDSCQPSSLGFANFVFLDLGEPQNLAEWFGLGGGVIDCFFWGENESDSPPSPRGGCQSKKGGGQLKSASAGFCLKVRWRWGGASGLQLVQSLALVPRGKANTPAGLVSGKPFGQQNLKQIPLSLERNQSKKPLGAQHRRFFSQSGGGGRGVCLAGAIFCSCWQSTHLGDPPGVLLARVCSGF